AAQDHLPAPLELDTVEAEAIDDQSLDRAAGLGRVEGEAVNQKVGGEVGAGQLDEQDGVGAQGGGIAAAAGLRVAIDLDRGEDGRQFGGGGGRMYAVAGGVGLDAGDCRGFVGRGERLAERAR